MQLATLLGLADHISTWMIAGGGLSLALFGIREARLDPQHPVKKLGDPIVSVALLPVGVMQFISFILYVFMLVTGERGAVALLPPEWQPYGLAMTAGYGGSMLLSSMANIGQIGRKVPWAVFTGLGVAAIGGGSVWHTASGLGLTTLPVLGGAAGIGLVLFVSMFFITLPGQETVKAVGDALAFGPVMVANSSVATVLGLLSAMGMVVL